MRISLGVKLRSKPAHDQPSDLLRLSDELTLRSVIDRLVQIDMIFNLAGVLNEDGRRGYRLRRAFYNHG